VEGLVSIFVLVCYFAGKEHMGVFMIVSVQFFYGFCFG
jgi:hypothetical protein